MKSHRLTTHLLSVDAFRNSGYRTTRLYPAATAILNLFFCAYFERYLKNDATGFYLSLFLLLQAGAYIVLSSTNFFTVSFEILSKARIYPTTPTDRMLFVIGGNCRRPILLSLVGSNMFFVIVLFRETFWGAILAALFYFLLASTIEVFLSASMLIIKRRSLPLEGAIVVVGFILLTLILGSLVFHYETLIASIPFIRWTVDGILGAIHLETMKVISSIAWLLTTFAVMLILGRRFA